MQIRKDNELLQVALAFSKPIPWKKIKERAERRKLHYKVAREAQERVRIALKKLDEFNNNIINQQKELEKLYYDMA
jgi:hypothetical protein